MRVQEILAIYTKLPRLRGPKHLVVVELALDRRMVLQFVRSEMLLKIMKTLLSSCFWVTDLSINLYNNIIISTHQLHCNIVAHINDTPAVTNIKLIIKCNCN